MYDIIVQGLLEKDLRYVLTYIGKVFDRFAITNPFRGEIEWSEDYPTYAWVYLNEFNELEDNWDWAEPKIELPNNYRENWGVCVPVEKAIDTLMELHNWATTHKDELDRIKKV